MPKENKYRELVTWISTELLFLEAVGNIDSEDVLELVDLVTERLWELDNVKGK